MKFKIFLKESEESYQTGHRPGGENFGAPIYNMCLNGIYDDDFYTLSLQEAVSRYGAHHDDDMLAMIKIRQVHNKPESQVEIYRAVHKIPKIIINQKKIEDYKRQKTQILRRGKIPRKADERLMMQAKMKTESGEYYTIEQAYYELISKEIERLEKLPPEPKQKPKPKLQINKGDWVTISRAYAVGHGKSNLRNGYQILTKTVKAKDLYTDGDSIMEFGYNPQI
jgi:hypothetical protein